MASRVEAPPGVCGLPGVLLPCPPAPAVDAAVSPTALFSFLLLLHHLRLLLPLSLLVVLSVVLLVLLVVMVVAAVVGVAVVDSAGC